MSRIDSRQLPKFAQDLRAAPPHASLQSRLARVAAEPRPAAGGPARLPGSRNFPALALLQAGAGRPFETAPRSLVEAGLPWFLALVLGLALVVMLLSAMQEQEFKDLRRSRLRVTLAELSERVERNLALGLELSDDSRMQPLIEDLLEREPEVRGIDIFDVNGVSVFNTDRASIGDAVPETWLMVAASTGPGKVWEVDAAGATVLGIIVHGPFGEAAGYVAVSFARSVVAPSWWFVGHAAAVLGVVALLALGAIRWAVRGDLDPLHQQALRAAVQRLVQAHVRLQFAATALRDADASSD